MTIIVGIKCSDGALIATDTQAEFGRGVSVKRLTANKIHYLLDRFAIGGAGTVAHIEKAVDAIEQGLRAGIKEKGGHLSKNECINTLEKTVTAVHKEYNIDRSRFLNDSREREFFQPILILCGVVSPDGEGEPCLLIVHPSGLVEHIHDYATAGSGAAYAELLLKNSYVPQMKLSEAITAAVYTINEVKQIDPSCGGETKVATVAAGKIKELSGDEIKAIGERSEKILGLIRNEITPKALRGEVDYARLEEISKA